MNKRLVVVFGAVVAVGLAIIIVLLIAPKSPISPSLKRQLPFALYVPVGHGITVDHDSAKYDSKLKLLTYTTAGLGASTTVSEQAAPDTFTDIPDYYSKLTASLGEYKTFDVPAGTVHLTHPPELKGKQAGVITSGGTLIFVKPSRDFSDDDWRQFFSALVLIR